MYFLGSKITKKSWKEKLVRQEKEAKRDYRAEHRESLGETGMAVLTCDASTGMLR